MWKAAEWGLSVIDMSDKKNATFDAQDASTLDIMESLKICMQLLDHSWQSGKVAEWSGKKLVTLLSKDVKD